MASSPGDETVRVTPAVSLAEIEARARARLDPATHALIADAAGEGISARRNAEAFRRRELLPRVLRDVSAVDTGTVVLGARAASPFGIAPLPQLRRVHPDGERALAEAAAAVGAVYCTGTNSSVALEDLPVAGGLSWFQLYPHRDPGVTRDLAKRAADAGYAALVVTVDRPAPGLKASEATKSTRAADYPNLAPYGDRAVLERWAPGFDWRQLADLCAASPIPVVPKGVLHPEDARLAADHGCGALWVSNHGGRQLDQAVASLDALERIADALGAGAELYVDGGVRRGLDAVIAAALGARAVFLGRPVAYALAAGGADGARDLLAGLTEELANALALMGAARLADVGRDAVG